MTGEPVTDAFTLIIYVALPAAAVAVLITWGVRALQRRLSPRRPDRPGPG
jgi:hypothetical protein